MILSKRIALAGHITQTSYVALVVAIGVLYLSTAYNLQWLFMQLVPLILFGRAVLRRDTRGLLWLCCILLLYVVTGVIAASIPGQHLAGLFYAVSVLTLFTAASLFISWKNKERKAARALKNNS